MFVKYAARMTRRTPMKTFLFILLLTLITAMIATSLGLTISLEQTMRDCRENYHTIAVAELYTGSSIAEPAEFHVAADQIANAPLPEGALYWEPAMQAQGCFSDIDTTFSVKPVKNKAVLLVKYYEDSNQVKIRIQDGHGNYINTTALPEQPQQVLVVKSFFSANDVEKSYIGVRTGDLPLEVGHYYLVCGEFLQGNRLESCLDITQNSPEFAPVDVTSDEEYSLPEQSPFFDLAEEYMMQERSFRVFAASHMEALFPFQQKAVEVIDGRMFTPEEENSGAAVCIISRQIAETLGLAVGDTTTLSLAVREDMPLLESYRTNEGFDFQKPYTVVGICDYQDGWNDAVFIPIPDGIDMTCNHSTSTLGQFHIDNDSAEQFRQDAAEVLPDGIQFSIYDQGYGRAIRPLEDSLRVVRIIAAVCLIVGFAFLLLLGWLLVYRQRQVGSLMIRIGAARSSTAGHYLISMALIALPATLLGGGISYAVSGLVAELVNMLLLNSSDLELKYSNSSLSLQRSDALLERTASIPLLAVICLAIFVLSLLLCLIFFEKSLPRHPLRQRQRSSKRRARSHSLRGGAFKYAFLSIFRGGFRSAVPVLAVLCAAVLFGQLTTSLNQSAAEFEVIGQGEEVRGYFSDYSGQTAGNIYINLKDVCHLADLGITESLSASAETNYSFYAAVNDGVLENVTAPFVPHSIYSLPTAERRMAYSPLMIFTNSISDLPKFLYSHAPEIVWLDGYDESMLAQSYQIDCHSYTVPKDGYEALDRYRWDSLSSTTATVPEGRLEKRIESAADEFNALVCIAPKSVMQAYGLELGDELLVINQIEIDYVSFVKLQIVGCYSNDDGRDDLIVPLSAAFNGKTLDSHGGNHLQFTEDDKNSKPLVSLNSAVFRLRSDDLMQTKELLSEEGFSEPYSMDGQRVFIVLEDSALYLSRHSMEQRLWYMQHIFPAVYLLTLALAVVFSVLQVQARKKELRLMRSLGTSAWTAFWSIYKEQFVLCLFGLAAGLGICYHLNRINKLSMILSVLFAGLWLFGAFRATVRACKGKLLKKHRDEG